MLAVPSTNINSLSWKRNRLRDLLRKGVNNNNNELTLTFFKVFCCFFPMRLVMVDVLPTFAFPTNMSLMRYISTVDFVCSRKKVSTALPSPEASTFFSNPAPTLVSKSESGLSRMSSDSSSLIDEREKWGKSNNLYFDRDRILRWARGVSRYLLCCRCKCRSWGNVVIARGKSVNWLNARSSTLRDGRAPIWLGSFSIRLWESSSCSNFGSWPISSGSDRRLLCLKSTTTNSVNLTRIWVSIKDWSRSERSKVSLLPYSSYLGGD